MKKTRCDLSYGAKTFLLNNLNFEYLRLEIICDRNLLWQMRLINLLPKNVSHLQ